MRSNAIELVPTAAPREPRTPVHPKVGSHPHTPPPREMLPGRGAAGVDGPGNHHWSHLSKWSCVAVWGGSGGEGCPPALRPAASAPPAQPPRKNSPLGDPNASQATPGGSWRPPGAPAQPGSPGSAGDRSPRAGAPPGSPGPGGKGGAQDWRKSFLWVSQMALFPSQDASRASRTVPGAPPPRTTVIYGKCTNRGPRSSIVLR